MALHPLAGQPVPPENVIDTQALLDAFYAPLDAPANVAFGTSGHRGSSLNGSFNEPHILAITQAICDYRHAHDITGPLYLGQDTHALSQPAYDTALRVLAANHVNVMVQDGGGYTPTPVISHAILAYNRGRKSGWADGIVITPSHNPPADGGFKYNSPSGGPASTTITGWIEARANDILADNNRAVNDCPSGAPDRVDTTHQWDFVNPYVNDLEHVVDMAVIAQSGIRIGVDPMGGSGVGYWAPIAERYGLSIDVVNTTIDPTFAFMTIDHDGVVRMDCSSKYAMKPLIGLRDRYDIGIGNDPDFDRHGVVSPIGGLIPPNHLMTIAVDYLFHHRPQWGATVKVGKTLGGSALIDRVARAMNRAVVEMPVGFKWFVDGLLSGELGFAGEESAGASFLRHDGTVWTTDKDGIIPGLLAAEIMAKTGDDLANHYNRLASQYGSPSYERIDEPANAQQRTALKTLTADAVSATELAGEPIVARLHRAPGNDELIGGIKISTENGWFAARPSGTEDIYKIYAESFRGDAHLKQIQADARAIVDMAFTR